MTKNKQWLNRTVIYAVLIMAVFGAYSIQWHHAKMVVPFKTDFAAAQRDAVASKKPLFVDFTASWCGPCQRMKSTTWADLSVAGALKNYVPVEVDLDANPDLAKKYQVESIPSLFVVDPNDGHVIKSNRRGAINSEEFLRWLKS